MSDSARRALARFAANHWGVFGIEHARACGYSDAAVDDARRRGLWVPVFRGALRLVGTPQLWEGDLFAATLAGGIRAHASHRSAGELWDLPGGARLLEITAPRWQRGRHGGVICHESTRIESIDLTEIAGIPVSTVERTLFDLAACTSERVLEQAVHTSIRGGLTTLDEIHATVERLRGKGRRGVGRLRRVLDLPYVATESPAETRLLQTLRQHNFADPVAQFVIVDERDRFVARVDFGYGPPHRVAVEYDSRAWHSTATEQARDAARRARIEACGWRVVVVRPEHLYRGRFGEISRQLIALGVHPRL